MENKDVEVTLSTSSNIQSIEDEYNRDEAKRSSLSLVKIYLDVDIDTFEEDNTLSTEVGESSHKPGTSAPTISNPTSSIVAGSFLPLLRQDILHKMGHLTHLTNICAS